MFSGIFLMKDAQAPRENTIRPDYHLFPASFHTMHRR